MSRTFWKIDVLLKTCWSRFAIRETKGNAVSACVSDNLLNAASISSNLLLNVARFDRAQSLWYCSAAVLSRSSPPNFSEMQLVIMTWGQRERPSSSFLKIYLHIDGSMWMAYKNVSSSMMSVASGGSITKFTPVSCFRSIFVNRYSVRVSNFGSWKHLFMGLNGALSNLSDSRFCLSSIARQIYAKAAYWWVQMPSTPSIMNMKVPRARQTALLIPVVLLTRILTSLRKSSHASSFSCLPVCYR